MIGGVCVIYGSQTGGGKKVGRGEKELLVVAGLGSRGKEEGKKDLLVVARLGSLAEAMEARGVGSCLNGQSTICSTA